MNAMNDELISKLGTAWQHYISLDHHKDRDCHFYVEKVWSYGQAPKYRAYHYGYIGSDWYSPYLDTADEAEKALISRMRFWILDAIEHLDREIETLDEDRWLGLPQGKEDLKEIRKTLQESIEGIK